MEKNMEAPISTDDLLLDAGMDGVKWAAAFKATAEKLWHNGMDEGWLIGWFCNAIMAGYDEADDGRPMNTDVFLGRLFEVCDDVYYRSYAINEWLHGDWGAALEYLEDEE